MKSRVATCRESSLVADSNLSLSKLYVICQSRQVQVWPHEALPFSKLPPSESFLSNIRAQHTTSPTSTHTSFKPLAAIGHYHALPQLQNNPRNQKHDRQRVLRHLRSLHPLHSRCLPPLNGPQPLLHQLKKLTFQNLSNIPTASQLAGQLPHDTITHDCTTYDQQRDCTSPVLSVTSQTTLHAHLRSLLYYRSSMGKTAARTSKPIDSRVHGFEHSCGIFFAILATGAILAKIVRPFFPH